MTVAQLIPVLQMSIGPAVLIAGVGSFTLSLTNRLARVIDRGRSLADAQHTGHGSVHRHIAEQLQILKYRAHVLQRSIFSAVMCVLTTVVLIITTFVTAWLKIEAAWLIGVLFFVGLGSLAVCLISFLQELKSSLVAFRLEIEE